MFDNSQVPFSWLLRQPWAGPYQQRGVFSAGHQRLVDMAQEKGKGLSIFIFLCAASVYFLLFNPYFSSVEVLVLTRRYLFIKYVQESAWVPVPPSKAGRARPASRSEGERRFLCLGAGRRRRRKGLRKIETSKYVSKYLQVPRHTHKKNISTVLSWGYRESGLK